MTAPSALLEQHRQGSRQLLETLSDLRPSLFRELAEGAVFVMVDAAEQLEARADAGAQLHTLAGETADVLTELLEALGAACRSSDCTCPGEVMERAAELSEQLRALTGNDGERR